MPAVELIGFAPDRPATEPGVMTDCTSVVPTENGFASAASAVGVSGLAALAAPCQGGVVVTKLDGTRRALAGTQDRLYEAGAGWVDVSRATAYTGGADSRWLFAQFGDTTLATNDVQPIQASTGGGAFADIATAPVARVVFSVGEFVMALNTKDGPSSTVFGDQGDRWWCCGIFDTTTWAPDISTQANSGRLVGGGGELTAGLALGELAIAYKARAMWRGTYVGGTTVWQWSQIEGDQGAVGPDAVCEANGVHIFVGDDNIWAFDGVRAVPVGHDDVRQWFFSNSSPEFRYRTIVQLERQNNRVWIFFPGSGSEDGTPDRALVYHLKTRRWGRCDMPVQAAFGFVQPGVTIDTLGSFAATIDDLPASFDSQFWQQGGRSLAVVDGTNTLLTLTGAPGAASFTTGDIGDDWTASRLSTVRLRFTVVPETSTATGQTKSSTGGATAAGGAASLYDGAYYLRQAGRWHQLVFGFQGATEFRALDHDLIADGAR